MSEGEIVHCLCDESHLPLWSYCDDDLFCPQCGQPIAGLVCSSQLPPGDPRAPVWVYPQKKVHLSVRQYVFPLTLVYADPSRRRKERAPAVDFARSSGPTARWFENRLERLPHDKASGLTCRLVRKDESQAGDTAPEELELPVEAIENTVELIGDFGRRTFQLKICNTPQISVELEGRGIEKADAASGAERGSVGRWEVMLSDVLEAELTLRAVTAPVYIEKELTHILAAQDEATTWDAAAQPEISVQLLDPLPAGTIIAPKQPWRSRIRIDTRQFLERGRTCQLIVNLKTAIVRTQPLILELERVEKGRVTFFPNPLTVEVMYAGELRSNAPFKNPEGPKHAPIHKLRVENVGADIVRLRPPRVEAHPASDRPWIRVAWATDVDPDSRLADSEGWLELEPGKNGEPGQMGEIEVVVDLRGFSADDLPPDKTLRATIVTVDERGGEWPVEFRVAEVQPRTPAPRPLAIDFGNSHSYAATWHPGEPFPLREPIVPTHDLRDPEAFPTVIFFEDLSLPERPVYSIGHEAAERGRSAPHALVSDLKRWIGAAEKSAYRMVSDESGEHTHRFDLETLIHLYLARLIERTETILRKHHVKTFGVSYPSRFSPERRAAFQRIVERFCEQSAGRYQLQALQSTQSDIDEANAVAVGFVFEPDVQQRELPQVVNADQPSFVVASFDLGGGSLDTALLRFTVADGNLDWPAFESEYLGIGGDERFGGDNVTVAVLELLLQRLRDNLDGKAAGLLERIPAPDEIHFAAREPAMNYHALRTAAEAIKIHQSRCARHAMEALAAAAAGKAAPGGARRTASESSREDEQRIKDILQVQLRGLTLDSDARSAIQEGIERGDFLIDLEEIYDHPIQRDMLGEGGYTVRQRIGEGVDELCDFARRRNAQIDFVVLGGSGCRLPLVEQVFRERLPHTRLIHDLQRTKFRVAYGLARYLHAQEASDAEMHRFARSRDYTSEEIGLVQHGANRFLPIVPNCSPVNNPALWHVLRGGSGPLPLSRILGRNRALVIYRQEHGRDDRPLGWFDLNEPAQPPTGEDTTYLAQLPDPVPANAVGEVRLVGSESEQELRVLADGAYYGCWRLKSGLPPR